LFLAHWDWFIGSKPEDKMPTQEQKDKVFEAAKALCSDAGLAPPAWSANFAVLQRAVRAATQKWTNEEAGPVMLLKKDGCVVGQFARDWRDDARLVVRLLNEQESKGGK
jgi:hypothetical protein